MNIHSLPIQLEIHKGRVFPNTGTAYLDRSFEHFECIVSQGNASN